MSGSSTLLESSSRGFGLATLLQAFAMDAPVQRASSFITKGLMPKALQLLKFHLFPDNPGKNWPSMFQVQRGRRKDLDAPSAH